MNARRRAQWIFAGLSVVLFGLALIEARWRAETLADPALVNGYLLYGLIVLLCILSSRKLLSMLPLGKASRWLDLHVFGGFLVLAVYFLHTRSFWPLGIYEQALAAFFYVASLSGVIGFFLQRVYPRQLVHGGGEVIFERIPAELASLRAEAESLVLRCTEECGYDTLARFYLDELAWFFARPRFFLSHALLTRRDLHWLSVKRREIERFLKDRELEHCAQLMALAARKSEIDTHYALQGIMKGWLFFHVPLAVATLIMATWHFFIIHAYAI